MIKVLVVEDFPVSQELLINIFNSDLEIKLIGTANNEKEAIEYLEHNKPDVITMDINMPKMDGYEAPKRIMMTLIVMITSSWIPGEVEKTFHATEAGGICDFKKTGE